MNQLVGPLKGRGRKKKILKEREREREKNRSTSVKTRVAIDTAAELKRKVDLEEEKFAYQKPENLMVNIQMQISAVREHIATIIYIL